MKSTLRDQTTEAQAAAKGAEGRDVSGLAEQRARAVRALDQTRKARQSGEVAKAGDAALKELETGLAGRPDPAPAGFLTARVVASGDAKTKLPAVPLSLLLVRLRTGERDAAEAETNLVGLAILELQKESKGKYTLEVLGPDGAVMAVQTGEWTPAQPSPVHLFELARSEKLKPQLERARPFEDGIRKARERAGLAREVAAKALTAQESRLVAYIAEIDAALACKTEPPEEPPERPEPPKPGEPTKPTEPTRPTKPDKPEQPTKPAGPTRPTEPGKPTEPNKPGRPTEPTKPTKPTGPVKPTVPTKPSGPTKPTKPTRPTKPRPPRPPLRGPGGQGGKRPPRGGKKSR